MSGINQGTMGTAEDTRSIEPREPKRRRLTHKRAIAIVVAVIVFVAAVVSVVALRPNPETVTIGVIIPMEQGPVNHAEEVKSAVMMAIEELNAWGGIGGTRLEMIVAEIVEDEESLAEAFEEMERNHDPLVYVTISCTLLTGLAPLAEAVSAPLIGLSSFPGATEGYQFTYRYNIPTEVEVGSTMSMMQRLNVSSVGLLYTESPRGCTIHDAFEEEFISQGGSLQAEGCAPGQTDFDEAVANLTGNDAIFAVSTCTSLVNMFNSIREVGYEGHVVASSCASSTFIWNIEAANGVYLSAPLLYKQENIPARAFREDFKQAFGIDLTHHGAVAYDIVHLVHDLLEVEGNEVTRSTLESELSKGFMFTGVMGLMDIASGDHDFGFNVYPAKIVEGELLYL